MHSDRPPRDSTRFDAKFRAVLITNEGEHPAKIRNISATGCLAVVQKSGLQTIPEVGDLLRLRLNAAEVEVECAAELRRIDEGREVLRRVLKLGLRFADDSFEVRKGIENAVQAAQLAIKVDEEAARWLS